MQILINDKLTEFDGKLFDQNGKISFETGEKLNFSENAKYIVPGFIDQHIHGVAGCDTMDGTVEAFETMQKALLNEGTTSFLATTMTYDMEVLKNILATIREHMKTEVAGANIVGVHLEGPFISENFIGAQNPNYVADVTVENFEALEANDVIKLVTYAVEKDHDLAFTKHLKSLGIIPSVGHSGASCDQVTAAIEAGMSNFTHLHNASTPYHHRTPGVVSAAYVHKDVMAELIVDGIHLNPATVKATYNGKGYENIALITDSMCAKAMADGEYALGGQKVIKKGLEARLVDGTLAGSVLPMNVAVKNMHNFSGSSLEEAFMMASTNVAKHLKLTTKGEITAGFDTDLISLDENFNVIDVFVGGRKLK
ncbi:MAG: N-acetylglucosamine-6-phosphate deacetylase [Mycoplasmatales bacterium]